MKMDRLISIIMLLLERKKLSATELARTFDVSTRTIYRDIDTIAQAGIPIVTYPGQNGGVGIMEQYKVDKRLFTASDITRLLIGLGGMHSAMSGDEITHTLAKVRGMIPPEQLSEIEFQTNQIAIDLTPWMKDSGLEEKLNRIKAALMGRRTLRFNYTNAYGSGTTREVEPYRLLFKGNSWYLQGYCLLRGEYRMFRFQRMEDLALTERGFEPRKFDPSVFDDWGEINLPLVEVCFRFDETVRQSIVEYFGEGAIVSVEDGMYTARIMAYDNEFGYDMFLMYGEKCEVLSPQRIRSYVAEKAAAIVELYGTKE